MDDRTRVAQITPTEVYPPNSGGRHRSHGIVTSFPGRGVAVERHCHGRPGSYLRGTFTETLDVADGYREVRKPHPIYDAARLPALGGYPYTLLSAALRVHTPRRFREAWNESEAVLVEGPWQLPAVARAVEDTPVVYSSHNVEADLYADLAGDFVYDHLLPSVSRIERRAVEEAAAIVAVSEENRERFREVYAPDCPVFVAPNGTYESEILPGVDPDDARAVRERYDVDEAAFLGVFVGTPHQPNVAAVRTLVELAEACAGEGIHFLVVGGAGEEVGDTPGNVTTAGFVEDLDPVYAAADFALNPVTEGSGSNVKMFDFLAHGLPVVSTPFGTRGIEIHDGEHALVAEPRDALDPVYRLRDDPELADALASNAVDLVSERYTWSKISERLVEDLKSEFEIG